MIASDACAAALWETAWPAHPNKGACTQHELFVVWACEKSERSQKINVMVHGDRQYTWIPAKRVLESTDTLQRAVLLPERCRSLLCAASPRILNDGFFAAFRATSIIFLLAIAHAPYLVAAH